MQARSSWVLAAVCCLATVLPTASGHAEKKADIAALFAAAEAAGRVGSARKTKLVDARPAQTGEVVVTIIAGQGKETKSAPAEPGDVVVRNRCPETGNEEFLVSAAKFAERYEGPVGAEASGGWKPFRPKGVELLYFVVSNADGDFIFVAPWGEPMRARPGDAIVRDPKDAKDTYRVARAAFACTYEVLKPAKVE